MDLSVTYASEFGKFSLGIENLLDKRYITYYSQTYAFADTDRYFSGRGRTITLGYLGDF